MRVPVKSAKGRRTPTPSSSPTYEVDLTFEEMREIKQALRARLDEVTSGMPTYRDTVSALAVIQWATEGRK